MSNPILKFKASLRVEAVLPDTVFVLSERKRSILNGRDFALVAPCIDGRRSLGDIAEALRGQLSEEAVAHVIGRLIDKGYVEFDQASPAHDAAAAFWELLGADGRAAQRMLALRPVAVRAVGAAVEAALPALLATLAAGGITVADDARLLVVATDDYLRPELADVVRQAGRPVLLMKVAGLTPTIGPLLNPPQTACLECLRHWLKLNRPVERLLDRCNGSGPGLPPAMLDAAGQAVFGLAAFRLARYLTSGANPATLANHLLALDLDKLETRRHPVVKRPQCPDCGDPGWMRRQAEQPLLQSTSAAVAEPSAGEYRICTPAETLGRYQHLVSPLTGPVAYLHPMPGRHGGERQVYVAGYLVSPQELPRGNSFDKICAGKGRTEEHAKTSALCEALERYSGVHQGDEAVIRGRLADFDGAAIHFNALQNFSHDQYARRDSLNALTTDRRKQVPQPFTETSEIDWTPAWSLLSGRRHLVPLVYCYAEAPPGSGTAYGIHNPNGAASGNCLEEAVLHGLFELVERDATAVWWYNRLPRPGIDLASFGDPYFTRLTDHYRQLGWDLWVLDLTHDLGLPVCAALARSHDGERYAIGFGCHVDAHLAVQRALTEVNQLFDPSGGAPAPWDTSKLTTTDFLVPSRDLPPTTAGRFPGLRDSHLHAALDHSLQAMRAAGLDVLAVDKTRPDIGLSVAQVIVPGLRHFWPRFGEGRLYTVPVALGWLPAPTPEDGLNPAHLFL